ncbi:MAG: PEP-CTERM sorting domain-containing protein [Pirellulales bacterium]
MLYFSRHSCALLILGAAAIKATAASYSFVNIADTRGPFEDFDFLTQAVSDTGQVAFIGTQGGVTGTYVGDGASTMSVVPDLSPPAGFNRNGDFALNESGVAAALVARCCTPPESKIQLYEASGTRNLIEVASSGTIARALTVPAINDTEAVAFGIRTDDSATGIKQTSITRWSNGVSETVLDTSAGFTILGATGLNELGEVAFQGFKDGEGWSYHRTDGAMITRIADSAGPLNISGSPRAAINDSGSVAFVASLDAGGEGIFVGNGGPLTTVAIADPTTPFYFIENDIDMNNQGTIAFFAGLWDGRNGIFTGTDPISDKVVAHGDILFGQFVTGLGRPHLNERGDIAFWFEVRDPREPDGYSYGIALAMKESPLQGDYNNDGAVDAADYVVWRKSVGAATLNNRDPNGIGPVGEADYNFWRAHFGDTIGTGAGAASSANAAVPEPASWLMLILGILAIFFRRRAVVP